MTIIYRVQAADGRGPWRPGWSHMWVEDREDHDQLLPWLEELGPVHRRALAGMHCASGCRTLNHLRRWFTPSEYDTLLGYGYETVEMNVDRILGESDTQLVFERCKPLCRDVKRVDLYPAAERKDTP